jgi:hypothetical protein
MATSLIRASAAVVLLFTQSAISAEYPSMEGRWVGNIRVVSSGTSAQVSSGLAFMQPGFGFVVPLKLNFHLLRNSAQSLPEAATRIG